MSLVDDIDAIATRPDLSAAQKRRLRMILRVRAVRDALATSLPRTFTVGQYSVTVFRVDVFLDAVRIWCGATKAGVRVPLSLPIILVNPPLLVPDPTGDVTRAGRDGLPDQVYRFAPLVAVGQVLLQLIRRAAP